MIVLAVLAILAAMALGGRRLGRALRNGVAARRPLGGVFSVVLAMAAAVLAIREDWLPALVMAGAAGAVALSARVRGRPRT